MSSKFYQVNLWRRYLIDDMTNTMRDNKRIDFDMLNLIKFTEVRDYRRVFVN